MTLSIITVNLNNAEGLLLTIKSVLIQIFIDYEFIIIDGGSSDHSCQLIEEYSTCFVPQNFKWISEKDAGVFNAMNKGIRLATGDYLLFLNSGDFLIDKNSLNMVFSDIPTDDILYAKCNVSDAGKILMTTDHSEILTFNTFYNKTIPHQSTFIKRCLFDSFGLYREDLKYMSDWEFWLRTIVLGKVSTRKVSVIVTDYNLDGISSDSNHFDDMQNERNAVYSALNLERIVEDYKQWELEQLQLKPYYWLKSKKFMHHCILSIYKLLSK